MNIYETSVQEFTDNWWEELLKHQRKEPGIIDSILLSNLVYDQGPKDQAGLLAREEGLEHSSILELRIAFKNILKIANLWSFKNLVKLQLDNNSISKIEELEHMIHLKWLDLSFNVIKKIENLDKLTNLRDLTLYHNQISILENMDELKQLEILSIGRNQIANVENTIYLRKFKSLRSVNFSHNPIAKHRNYRLLLIVYVPQLVTIDYCLVSAVQREEANAEFENTVTGLEVKDKLSSEELHKKMMEEKKEAFNKLLFLEAFADNKLIELMFLVDEEESKLRSWDIINNLFDKYYQGLQTSSSNLYQFGLKKYKQREEELRSFHQGAQEVIELYNNKGIFNIDDFLEYKKAMWAQLDKVEPSMLEEQRTEFENNLKRLTEGMILDEIILVEMLCEMVKELEMSLDEMINEFKVHVTSRISSLREMTHRFYEDLLKEANLLAEKVRKPDEIDEIPADISYLISDKMLLSVTIQTAHESRIAKIDNVQDDILARLSVYVSRIIVDLNEHMEMKRNRKRIQEIQHFTRHYYNEAQHIFDLLIRDD